MRALVNKRLLDYACKYLVTIAKGLILIFLLIPIVVATIYSFDPRDFFGSLPPPSLSLRWYIHIITDKFWMESLRFSFILGLCAAIISLGMGVPAAIFLVRYEFKGKEVLKTIFLAPLVIPGVVIGVSLLTIFSVLGMRNSFVNLLIAHAIITLPYVVRTVLGSLIGFDRSLEEAAMNLGANEIQTFLKITLPIIKPGVIASIVFAFFISFDDVAVSSFLVTAKTTTFSVAIFSYMRSMFNPSVAAASGLTMILAFTFMLMVEKFMGLDRFVGV